jgi:hypothetical protein
VIGSLVVAMAMELAPEFSTADARVLSEPAVSVVTPAYSTAGARVTVTGTNFYRGQVHLTWDGRCERHAHGA